MTASIISLIMGVIFGASLVLAGFTDPDKIISSLRLKDFHALRTIVVAVLVAIIGTWLLGLGGAANLDIEAAAVLPVLIGGAFVGIGLGLAGFWPGTGLAGAASGRLDALAAVIGMFFGAHVYILIYPSMVAPLERILNYGQVTLPQMTGTSQIAWIVPVVAAGSLALLLTRSGRKERAEPYPKAEEPALHEGGSRTLSSVLRTDGLEAVGVFRAWKNFLFVLAVLCLVLLQIIFWLANTGQVEMGQPNFAQAAEAPGAQTLRLLPFDLTFEHIASIVDPANAILVFACVLYGLTTFFALTVSIAGGLGGLGHLARAFYLSLVALILTLPWQTVLGHTGLGAIYTPRELADLCTANAGSLLETGLFYLRFSGTWALAVLVLIWAQCHTSRWTKAALLKHRQPNTHTV